MNYHEIKESLLESTKDYSDKKLKRYIIFHRILFALYSEFTFWFISLIPFIIIPIIFNQTQGYLFFLFVNYLYWVFWGQKNYHKECDEDIEELCLIIEVLEDIKKERNEK
jgi:hypothetical protein